MPGERGGPGGAGPKGDKVRAHLLLIMEQHRRVGHRETRLQEAIYSPNPRYPRTVREVWLSPEHLVFAQEALQGAPLGQAPTEDTS